MATFPSSVTPYSNNISIKLNKYTVISTDDCEVEGYNKNADYKMFIGILIQIKHCMSGSKFVMNKDRQYDSNIMSQSFFNLVKVKQNTL